MRLARQSPPVLTPFNPLRVELARSDALLGGNLEESEAHRGLFDVNPVKPHPWSRALDPLAIEAFNVPQPSDGAAKGENFGCPNRESLRCRHRNHRRKHAAAACRRR